MKRAYDGYSHGGYEQCGGVNTIKSEPRDFGTPTAGQTVVEDVSNRSAYDDESFRGANQHNSRVEICSEIKIENSDRIEELQGHNSKKVKLDDCQYLEYSAQAALSLAPIQTNRGNLPSSASSSSYFPSPQITHTIPAPITLETIFNAFSEFRAEIIESLNNISNRIERLETAICGPKFHPPAKFPIKTLEELHQFIGKMKNEEVRQTTISYFKNMQPRSKEMVVKFMRSHFADDLLILFNYRGEQGKQSFKNNELFSLLTEVWINEYFTLDEIQNIFKEELSKCRGRRKQQKMRESRKHRSENIS